MKAQNTNFRMQSKEIIQDNMDKSLPKIPEDKTELQKRFDKTSK